MNGRQIQGLERIARLKADLEMGRFAAIRAHVDAARQRIGRIEDELQALYLNDGPFSVPEARLTNILAAERSRALVEAEAELQRLLPRYDEVRRAAAREFGRAEAIHQIGDGVAALARKKKQKKDSFE